MEVAGVNITNTDRYVFVYDADGNPHELHYYASGATTPTKYYYVLNLQGDVIQLRDSNSAVVANYTYDAWGKLLSVTNANGEAITSSTNIANVNPIRYRGYFYDSETKLYYCNSRYYDPQIKRFINADELVSTGTGFLGYNMFAYCENNPVMYCDPSGCVVTGWDMAYLSSGDTYYLYLLTCSWHSSASQQERDEIHKLAVNVRKEKLPLGYKVASNGYVVSSDGSHYLSTYSFDSYNIDYKIQEHVISVDVRQTGIGVLYAVYMIDGNDLKSLATNMLAEYKAIYGKEFHGRSISGIAREIMFHYLPDTWFNVEPLSYLLQDILLSHTNIADIEDTLHGSKTWKAFEPIWNW